MIAARLSGRSETGKAVAYLLNHWDGLRLFLEDGRVEMDTNLVETQIRRKRDRMTAYDFLGESHLVSTR